MVRFSWFFEEQSRWFLWWPVGLGIGISFYFSLPQEPSFLLALTFLLVTFAVMSIIAYFWFSYTLALLLTLALLSLSLGFFAAKARTDWLATPFLQKKVKDARISARIIDIEEQPHRRRLTFDTISMPKGTPALRKIRLTMPLSQPLTATVGDRASLTAFLLPPSNPVSINGYNFRRQAYFQGIGAIGRIKSLHRVDSHQSKSTLR